MSGGGDSTELSFVRCPACRSLVPAVSTRCRMCGAGLEGAGKAVTPAAVAADPVIEADPLSAYIEEVVEATPVSSAPVFHDHSFNEHSSIDNESTNVDLDLSPSALPTNPEPIEEAPRVESKPVRKPIVDFDDDGDDDSNMDFASKLGRRRQKEVVKPKEEEVIVREEPEQEQDQSHSPSELKPQGVSIKSRKVEREIPATKLFGWLIKVDDDSHPIELREGKFFITRSSLKASDLVLDDESISTPHALFYVNVEKGISVQDLVSDSGVFVKKYKEEDFARIEIPVRLDAGDRVRFGSQEFVLAVVPY